MSLHNILLIVQVEIIAGLFIESWIIFKKLKNPLHIYLLLSCICSLTNNVGYLLELKSNTEEAFIASLKFSYLGRIWYVFFLFMFICELVNFKLPEIYRKALMVFHGITYISIFTLEDHNLYYTSREFLTDGLFPKLRHGNGIFHHLTMAMVIMYAIIGLSMMIKAYRKDKYSKSGKRILTVIVSVAFQGVFFLIQMIGIKGITDYYDISMIGYFFGTIIMFIAIYSFNLLDTGDVVKDYVIDRISEGIIATDNKGIIQYYNDPALSILPGIAMDENPTKERKENSRTQMMVMDKVNEAVSSDSHLRINENIYHPEVRELVYNGERLGNVYTLVDETEHFKYMEDLKEQRKIAESASKAKSRFLANMSHEIRTPINAVLGMDEMILRESGEKNIRGYAANIMSAGRSLLSLINDILDLSKVEEGKMEIIPVQYELSSLLNDLVNMIRERAEKKGLEFKIDVDNHIPHMLIGDEVRVRQCAMNILTNAVKYTEKGSVNLSVGFDKVDGFAPDKKIKLRFTVEDTGIGMKQEDMDKLFSPYSRIEEGRNRNIEGTGLGMSITMQLLELMGSELDVKSEYGKGSVFSFEVEQEVSKAQEIGNFAEKISQYKSEDYSYTELFRAPDARILVVDDTEVNLTVICSLLKKTQIGIDTAMSGKEALMLTSHNKYDIVFIDHMMSEMDGIETLHNMRKSGLNTETPAVALTANAVSGAREMYLEAGFTNYLSKPIDSGKLEMMIKDMLPEDKIEKTVIKEAASVTDETSIESYETVDLPDWLKEIPELDVFSGIKYCGSTDGFYSVLTVYHETYPIKSAEIKEFYDKGDIDNYTVKVHALKSSSRIIGAAEISALSAKLEEAGKLKNIEFINEYTGKLLEMYGALDKKLSPFDDKDESLPLIDKKQLCEAYQTIYEIAQCMDFSLMDNILTDLQNYSFEKEDEKTISEIKMKFNELEWEEISEIASKASTV